MLRGGGGGGVVLFWFVAGADQLGWERRFAHGLEGVTWVGRDGRRERVRERESTRGVPSN